MTLHVGLAHALVAVEADDLDEHLNNIERRLAEPTLVTLINSWRSERANTATSSTPQQPSRQSKPEVPPSSSPPAIAARRQQSPGNQSLIRVAHHDHRTAVHRAEGRRTHRG